MSSTAAGRQESSTCREVPSCRRRRTRLGVILGGASRSVKQRSWASRITLQHEAHRSRASGAPIARRLSWRPSSRGACSLAMICTVAPIALLLGSVVFAVAVVWTHERLKLSGKTSRSPPHATGDAVSFGIARPAVAARTARRTGVPRRDDGGRGRAAELHPTVASVLGVASQGRQAAAPASHVGGAGRLRMSQADRSACCPAALLPMTAIATSRRPHRPDDQIGRGPGRRLRQPPRATSPARSPRGHPCRAAGSLTRLRRARRVDQRQRCPAGSAGDALHRPLELVVAGSSPAPRGSQLRPRSRPAGVSPGPLRFCLGGDASRGRITAILRMWRITATTADRGDGTRAGWRWRSG